jgi:putative addiction module component (TIGR02574 family)
MSTTAQKVCIEALSLPQRSRAEIAETLLSSLDEEMDAGSERAWKLEIRRRRREIREGKTKLITADEVMRSALRALLAGDEDEMLYMLKIGMKSQEHGTFGRKRRPK